MKPEHIEKASITSLNKTAKKARTAQSVKIRKTYNITAKRLDVELMKVTGNNLGTANNPRAIILAKKIRKGNPGLQHYSASKVRKGISYKIRKDNKRKTRLHAFEPNSSTTIGIYLRKGDKRIMSKGSYKGKLRQPIIRQTGPSVIQMMKRVGIKAIKRSAKDNFQRLFIHELKRKISRIR